MPIDLYLAPMSPPCRAVLMTAKELGIELNCRPINARKGEQNEPWFLKMNPQHCVPTIDDNGFYLWESRAIMTYLVNKYAPESSLYPKDPQRRAVVDRMLHFDIGTLYQTQRDYFYPHLMKGEELDPGREAVYKKALLLLNGVLERSAYVAGPHLTLADFSVLTSITMVELADYDLSPYPKIVAWLSRMKSELPYYSELIDEPLKEFRKSHQHATTKV